LSPKTISDPTWGVMPKGNPLNVHLDGKYAIGKLKEPPTCSLGTNVYPPHLLP